MAKKKTHEEFVAELKIKAPDIEVIGEYINAVTPIRCRCKICGYDDWYPIPNSLLRGHGCPECAGNKTKTTEEFKEEIHKLWPNIRILGEYKGSNVAIDYICDVCKTPDSRTPTAIKKGGCKVCSRKKADVKRKQAFGTPISDADFKNRMRHVNPNIKIISTFSNMKDSVEFICECGNRDTLKPQKLLNGSLCKKCRNKKLRRERIKSEDTYVAELKKVNPNIVLLSEYKGSSKPIKYRCTACGTEGTKKTARELLQGIRCSGCTKRMTSSFPEQAIFFYLKKHYVNAMNKYKEGFGRQELDIYIPDISTGIEYDGRLHKNQIESERKKYKLCQDRGIILIRVRALEIEASDRADIIIKTQYGYTKKFKDLDESIIELFKLLKIHEDINTERDRISIQEQYFKGIRENSVAARYPDIAKEWYQPMNGNITPDMVAAQSNDPYYWLCPKCNKPYLAIVSNKTKGYGHRCSCIADMTNEEFKAEVAKANPNVELRGELIDSETCIEWRCKIHNTINHSRPKSLLAGCGCQECRNDKLSQDRRKTQEIFIEEVAKKNPDVIILGEYKGDNVDILCKHKSCGHVLPRKPRSILNGFACPECSKVKSKKVVCLDDGRIYNSIHQAEVKTGISHALISRCCNGKAKTAGKKRWMFVEDGSTSGTCL